MHAEYRWIFEQLEARDDVRAVIVTGSGDRFCVGGDSEALRDHVERGGYDTGLPPEPSRPGGGDGFDADFAWQLGYRHPIVAAVNGACAGVGLALVTFCDLRFVTPTAKLTTAAPKLGLPAEYGISWTLPRLIGATRASDLLLSGRVFTGVGDRRVGALERRRRRPAGRGDRMGAAPRGDDRPHGRDHHQTSDRGRPRPQLARDQRRRITPADGRGDGHRRVRRGHRGLLRGPLPRLLNVRRGSDPLPYTAP